MINYHLSVFKLDRLFQFENSLANILLLIRAGYHDYFLIFKFFRAAFLNIFLRLFPGVEWIKVEACGTKSLNIGFMDGVCDLFVYPNDPVVLQRMTGNLRKQPFRFHFVKDLIPIFLPTFFSFFHCIFKILQFRYLHIIDVLVRFLYLRIIDVLVKLLYFACPIDCLTKHTLLFLYLLYISNNYSFFNISI